MGEEIKSALELALERTADIKSDKGKLEEYDLRQTGKRIASKFLHPIEDEEKINLQAELKKYSGKQNDLIKKGIFDVIMSNLTLPSDEIDEKLMQRLEEALDILTGNKRQISSVFQQLNQFFSQYLKNKQEIKSSLEQQFAPRLRQKEQAMAQKFGQEVHLDAVQDPEFAEHLKKNYAELDKQYQEALDQMKGQLRQILGMPA